MDSWAVAWQSCETSPLDVESKQEKHEEGGEKRNERTGKGTEGRGKTKDQTMIIRGQRKEKREHRRWKRTKQQTVGHWDRQKQNEELKGITTDYTPFWLVKLKPPQITKCPSFVCEIPWNDNFSLRSMANTSQHKPHHFIAPSSLHQASNLRRALWSLLTSPADKLGDGWCGLHERSQNKIRNKLKKLKNKTRFDLHAQDHAKHPYK